MKNIISTLYHIGILEVNGDDSSNFLQSQLTSDINKVDDKSWQFSAWCNPQGRIISNFILYRSNKTYYLLLPISLVEAVRKRLSMYIFRSKVSVTNKSNDMSSYGVYSKDMSTIENLPGLKDNFINIDISDNHYQRNIIIPLQSTSIEAGLTSSDITTIDNITWQTMDVNVGIPWITMNTTETTIPQELDLNKLDGLSLNKGCFPGQEIIARLHYRGKVKHGLFMGEIQHSDYIPHEGEKLYAENGKELCGTILNIVSNKNGHMQILAVVNLMKNNLETYYLENNNTLNAKFSTTNYQRSI
ncbi:MAG: CAF17-like 4Fe-4S cluster assembly/insertion protein YgfZ [Gammaproteobacteria bacterium]